MNLLKFFKFRLAHKFTIKIDGEKYLVIDYPRNPAYVVRKGKEEFTMKHSAGGWVSDKPIDSDLLKKIGDKIVEWENYNASSF